MKRLIEKIRESRKTKDFLVLLVFIAIAAVFWFILALNDDIQDSYDVSLEIENVPDTVTFISLPPAKLHVNVRNKGLNHLRHQIAGLPTLRLNFPEYAEAGKFRISQSSLQAAMRQVFGSNSIISSVSPDSIKFIYTTLPGKRIPIELLYDVSVAPGMVLGQPKISTQMVEVFSTTENDTLRRLETEKVVLRNIDKTTTVDVPIQALPGKRIIPPSVKVTFVVEQLVKKESEVMVVADNIPLGHDILFFPSRVRVSYYVPMSRYAEGEVPIKVEASFNEAFNTTSDKVGIHIVSQAPYLSNVELMQDSVEYTVVKN